MRTKTTPFLAQHRAFAEALEWKLKIDWFDAMGVHEIDGLRLAKLELWERSDNVLGVAVTIVHKLSGPIDNHTFLFSDYLSLAMADRTDTRADYEATSFHGWRSRRGRSGGDDDQLSWYIAVPKTTRPFCAAVERWIDAFRVAS